MMRRQQARFRGGLLPLALAAVAPLSGCAGAPAVNVVGSYFPAWMLCAIVGVTVAVCFRQVLVLVGLENSLPVPLVTHAAVALAVTLAVWLVWFGH
jgi:hypothetical protein